MIKDLYRHQLQKIEAKEIKPGFWARMIHTGEMTIAFWEVEKGAELPLHHHPHEQVSIVTSGEFEMTIDGDTETFFPGKIATIQGDIPHSGKAHTRCEIIDIFRPERKEYK